MIWKRQFTRSDAWNVACVVPGHHNCPEEDGEDLDFGAPPILATVNGRDYLLAGQKSGRVFALDPGDGATLWTRKVGSGGKAGGVHFGMARIPGRGIVYVPISDRDVGRLLGDSGSGKPRPSLHALDIETGETRWAIDSPADCLEPAAARHSRVVTADSPRRPPSRAISFSRPPWTVCCARSTRTPATSSGPTTRIGGFPRSTAETPRGAPSISGAPMWQGAKCS